MFYTRYKYFKYYIILFRLINAPITFQIFINKILVELLNNIYITYINNILIFNNTREKYITHV